MKNLWRLWKSFWFHPLDLYNLAMMRMLLGITWLLMYSLRHARFELFYSESGILPLESVSWLTPEYLHSVWPFYFESTSLLYASHWVFLVLLLGLSLGLFGRSLTWLVFVLHIGFLQRNPGLTYGADLFSTFWLFGLSFTRHNMHFSLWNILKEKSARAKIHLQELNSDWLSSVGYRLIQLQLCFVYAFTGIEKLKGASWWDGTALWRVVTMKDLVPWDYTFLYHVPLLVAFLTITTLIFEVYFPAAMLNKKLRPYWLGFGVLFHAGIALFIAIPFFGLVMVIPYLLFIDPMKLRLQFNALKSRFLPKSWA